MSFEVPDGLGARAARTRTARARPPRCASSPRCCGPTRGAAPRARRATSPRTRSAVRASIGLAGQYAAVDENLTAHENLRLVGRLTHLSDAEIIEPRPTSCSSASTSPHAGRPRSLRTFSGGMRRRLDLAAALVHRPAGAVPRRADDRPRPAGPHRALGRHRGRSWRAAPPCCSRRSTSKRPTGSPTHRRDRPRLGDRRGHVGGAQGPAGRDRDRGRRSATTHSVGTRPSTSSRRSATVDRARATSLRVNVDDGADGDARGRARARRRAARARRRWRCASRRSTTCSSTLTGHAAEEPTDDDDETSHAEEAGRRDATRGAA